MSVREIVLYPDERLRQKCKPVDEVSASIKNLIDDMLDTLYDAPGVGLAAPQVGILERVIVIDCSEPETDPDPFVLINPEIIAREGSFTWEEGCLSIPGVFDKVKRAQRVRVRALNREGSPYEFDAEELLAVCVQHEIDHLNGVLFLDHLTRLRLRMAQKKYKRTLPTYLKEQQKKAEKREEEAQNANPTSALRASMSLTKDGAP